MESKDHRDDLEIFLKEKSDSYKMYPSEKIWANLNNQLHPRKKWPYLVMAVIFLGLGFGGKVYDTRYNSISDLKLAEPQSQPSNNASVKDALPAPLETLSMADEPGKVIPFDTKIIREINAEKRIPDPKTVSLTSNLQITSTQKQYSIPGSIATSSVSPSIVNSAPEPSLIPISNSTSTARIMRGSSLIPASNSTLTVNSAQGSSLLPSSVSFSTEKIEMTAIKNSIEQSLLLPENTFSNHQRSNSSISRAGKNVHDATLNQVDAGISLAKGSSDISNNSAYSLPGNSLPADNKDLSSSMETGTGINANQTTATTNAIRVKKPYANRLGWQLYFSPTKSYRRLSGNVNKNALYSIANAAYSTNSPTDLKSAVSQTPAVGMELGTAMIYKVGKRIRIKGGLQFNYSQYNINAFDYSAEIAPLSAAGIGHTEINAVSFHRNFNGFSKALLKNEHFMISVPLGAEMSVVGNKVVQFNVAATIQPGFMLNNQAYLLSTNLTNYAKVPSLYRDFNINSSLEAFLTVQLGSIKWSVGPQLRYQLLSTYKKSYPFSEHLLDYGIKLGMTKTIK